MTAPKKTIQHDIDRTACSYFRSCVTNLATVEHADDYGVDFTAEFFDEFNGPSAEISGLDFHVQCKGTGNLDHDSGRVKFRLQTSKLAYYVDKKRRPVFLVVVDTARMVGYWIFLQGFARDNLNNAAWRKQDTVTIEIPKDQRLDDIEALRSAVEDADQRMRDFWPGDPLQSVLAEKQRIEECDPRIEVDVHASTAGKTIAVRCREPITGQIAFSGESKQVDQVLAELFDRGRKVVASEYDIEMTATNLPGYANEKVKISEITSKKELPGSVRIAQIASSGMEIASLEIEGEFEGGAKEMRFRAEIPSKLVSVEATMPNQKGEPLQFQYRCSIDSWANTPLQLLPDFDRLHRLLSPLPESGSLRFELFVHGNLLGSHDLPRSNLTAFIPFGATLHWIGVARSIARRLDEPLKFLGSLTPEELAEIDFADRFLRGEEQSVTLNEISFSTRTRKSEADKLTGESLGRLRIASSSFPRMIFQQQVDLGPASFTFDGSNITKVGTRNDPDSVEYVLVDWKCSGPATGTVVSWNLEPMSLSPVSETETELP